MGWWKKRVGLPNVQLTSVVSLVGWYSNRMSLSSLFGFLMRRTTLSGRDAIGAATGAGAAGKKTSLHVWNLERAHDKSWSGVTLSSGWWIWGCSTGGRGRSIVIVLIIRLPLPLTIGVTGKFSRTSRLASLCILYLSQGGKKNAICSVQTCGISSIWQTN